MDDLFAKIIRGEIPSTKIYEDENTFAFLDITPVNKGHVLVIPKTFYRNILDIEEEDWCRLMETVRTIATAVKKATNADGINIVMNNEPAGGQEVFHAHVHIVPRFNGDGMVQKPKRTEYGEGEKEKYGEMITSAL